MFDNVNISLRDASFATGVSILERIHISSGSGNIALSNEGVVYFDANGFVNEAVLENENFWIAEIPETNFEISSELGAITPKKYLTSRLTLDFGGNPVSSASIGSDIDFRGYDVAQCLRSICSEITHKINYELEVSNEKIKGYSECSSLSCSESSSRHRLETLNTEKFMSNLVQTSMVNPVLTALLFAELLSGKKTHHGHMIEY